MCLIFLPLNLTRHLTSEVKVYNKTYEVLRVGIEESLDAVEIGVEGVRKKRRTVKLDRSPRRQLDGQDRRL